MFNDKQCTEKSKKTVNDRTWQYLAPAMLLTRIHLWISTPISSDMVAERGD